jgi:hypothetical protein
MTPHGLRKSLARYSFSRDGDSDFGASGHRNANPTQRLDL